MVANFCAGGAAINVLARHVGAEVVVVDVGVATPIPDRFGRAGARATSRSGPANLAVEPAMTTDEAAAALDVGLEVARQAVSGGARMLVTGDMGIGNTTPAAALIAARTGRRPAEVTGRGTGIDDAMLERKTAVIAQALARLPSGAEPLVVLAELGGLEIAALCGFVVGAAPAVECRSSSTGSSPRPHRSWRRRSHPRSPGYLDRRAPFERARIVGRPRGARASLRSSTWACAWGRASGAALGRADGAGGGQDPARDGDLRLRRGQRQGRHVELTGSLLVAGTSSGAGKSTLVAGLCRWFARNGVSVAPFKAQNMSLNSFVTRAGEEIGRAQAAQAQAARIEPEARHEPGAAQARYRLPAARWSCSDERWERWRRRGTGTRRPSLLDVVVDAYGELRKRFDVVICEGAGSPAEINLRSFDIVNLGFARAVGAPVIVVSDIDRGGMFASLVGTLALLDDEDQRRVQGFVVNRFRGDRALLDPGLDMLRTLTGRPTFGVLPYVEDLWVDEEDSPDPAAYRDPGPPVGADTLRVGVVRLPRASNLTDLDPLAAEPGVTIRFVTRPQEIADADLIILPGTRATVDDLDWVRRRGIDGALARPSAAAAPRSWDLRWLSDAGHLDR